MCLALDVCLAVITFDDAPTGQVAAGYQGFTWNNFYTLDSTGHTEGYKTGTVSAPNVAFDADGEPASFSYSAGTFDLLSMYLIGARVDGTGTVTGSVGGTTVATIDLQIYLASVTYFQFTGFTGLDTITMTPDVNDGNHHFALDNMGVHQHPHPQPAPPSPPPPSPSPSHGGLTIALGSRLSTNIAKVFDGQCGLSKIALRLATSQIHGRVI